MKYIPHEYQRYCIQRVITDPAIALLLDMGLGKTSIVLTAVNDLKYNRLSVSKVLVIAPKKVAESTWLKETAKWDHLSLLRVIPILGNLTARLRALNSPADVYVINRENVSWLVDYLRNDWFFDMVVIDESSSFKNHRAKRFKALKAVRPHIKRIVELTGTPAPNGLIDLWAQMFLLDGGQRLGKTITGFRERYFNPDQRNATQVFSYKPKDEAKTKIYDLIGDIAVSMQAEDYLQLPDCTIEEIPVVLDAKAQRAYQELEKEMILDFDDEIVTAASAAALSNKLQQLCNGAVYKEDRSVVEIHDCKVEAFMELIEQLNGQPVLVFYNFQHDLSRLEAALSKTKLRVRRLQTSDDEDAWNRKEIDVLLAHPASAAYGLNLQDGGNHVVWFGLNWSLELFLQANKRLHRQGQLQKVIIHVIIVAGGRDADIATALQDKETTQDDLLNSLKARIDKIKEAA